MATIEGMWRCGWRSVAMAPSNNGADVTQVDKVLHGVELRLEHAGRKVVWQIAARRSTYRRHGKRSLLYRAKRRIEKAKAQLRAKLEHPFRGINRQFGYTKVRFRGLAKSMSQLVTLFALSILWMPDGICWPRWERCAYKMRKSGQSLGFWMYHLVWAG